MTVEIRGLGIYVISERLTQFNILISNFAKFYSNNVPQLCQIHELLFRHDVMFTFSSIHVYSGTCKLHTHF